MRRIFWTVALLLCVVAWVKPALCASAEDAPAKPGFLGILPKDDGGWLTVGGVVEDSPAKRAGLAGGERILKINGIETQGKPLMENARLLTGPAGEKVVLTLLRPAASNAQPFEVALVRAPIPANLRRPGMLPRAIKADWSRPPTRDAGQVQWNGNKIVSRVLPYPDFISLFIRLPIAHAAALGDGVQVCVLQTTENNPAQILVENIAPKARVKTLRCEGTNTTDVLANLKNERAKVALVANPELWPGLVALCEDLLSKQVLVVVPADLSEDPEVIGRINQAQKAGALTVGRVDRQSCLFKPIEGGEGGLPFNKRIREIQTDLFSTIGVDRGSPPVIAAATAAGVAALVLEKWPGLSAAEVRTKLLTGARSVWQMTGDVRREMPFTIDPVTTEFKPKSPASAFRFRALDAAGALGVDTEIPWFLNILNCKKAWAITRGKGVRAVISDQGFHIRHPELTNRIESTREFGPARLADPDQNFHGTDMSRIFLAIAPEARIVPVLCSAQGREDLVQNIAKSFRYAAEIKADVVSGSWAGWFNTDTNLLQAVQEAVNSGTVVSWFHYPKPYPGLLRPMFTYAGGWDPESRLGFLDRFTTDPPGFHPVEIEAGLSATAPQAAAIAALVKSVNPKLTPKDVETLIVKHSTPIGGGILIPDAWKIVQAAQGNE